MTPIPPPEVGSLWEHEDGERRYVYGITHYGPLSTVDIDGNDSTETTMGTDIEFLLLPDDGCWCKRFSPIEKWHAWAAKARRLA